MEHYCCNHCGGDHPDHVCRKKRADSHGDELARLRAEVAALTRQRDAMETERDSALARAEEARACLDRVHRALGEDPSSDDPSLGDRVATLLRERDERIGELTSALAASEQARAEAERQRDEWQGKCREANRQRWRIWNQSENAREAAATLEAVTEALATEQAQHALTKRGHVNATEWVVALMRDRDEWQEKAEARQRELNDLEQHATMIRLLSEQRDALNAGLAADRADIYALRAAMGLPQDHTGSLAEAYRTRSTEFQETLAAARAEGEALKVAARALLSDPAMTVEVPDEPEVIVHPATEDEAAVRKCSPVCAVCVTSPCAPDCTAGRLRALSGPSATTGGED